MQSVLPSRKWRQISEECKYDTLQIGLYPSLHLVARHVFGRTRDIWNKTRKQQRENYKNGRERPHFFSFQPPKKFVGSLPPSGTGFGAGSFSIVTDRVTKFI